MIPKGCTCIHSFTIPYTKDEIATLYITYKQKDTVVFEKTMDDCVFTDGRVLVNLIQEDTLSLDSNVVIDIQIRVRLENGIVTKSNIVQTITDFVLKEGVI